MFCLCIYLFIYFLALPPSDVTPVPASAPTDATPTPVDAKVTPAPSDATATPAPADVKATTVTDDSKTTTAPAPNVTIFPPPVSAVDSKGLDTFTDEKKEIYYLRDTVNQLKLDYYFLSRGLKREMDKNIKLQNQITFWKDTAKYLRSIIAHSTRLFEWIDSNLHDTFDNSTFQHSDESYNNFSIPVPNDDFIDFDYIRQNANTINRVHDDDSEESIEGEDD